MHMEKLALSTSSQQPLGPSVCQPWPVGNKRVCLTFLALGKAAEGQHEDHSEDTDHLALHGSFTGRPRVMDELLPEFLTLYRGSVCLE